MVDGSRTEVPGFLLLRTRFNPESLKKPKVLRTQVTPSEISTDRETEALLPASCVESKDLVSPFALQN